MRIVNRAHLPWFLFVVAATLFAFWLYLGNFQPGSLPAGLHPPASLVQKSSEHRTVGGTPLGLIFGSIALAIFVFASLLGVRKKLVLWRIGTLQRWMRAHIWLTLLTIPLVLLHCGFRLGGPMTTLLIGLYVIVMVSGIYGLILQHYLPTTMMNRIPAESVYEQIPHIRAQLLAAAKKMHESFKSVSRTDSSGGEPAAAVEPDAGAPAPSAEKAVTAGSTPMSSTSGELSTPTARAKTVAGSSVTAETVSVPQKTEPNELERPIPARSPTAPETMGTPTARVPEGVGVPAGTEKVTGVAPPAVTPQSVSPPTPVPAPIPDIAAGTAGPGSNPQATPAQPGSPIPAKVAPAAPKPTPVAVAKPAAPPTDADSESALHDFLERQILPYLSAKRGDRMLLGNARFSEDTFRFVKLRVTESYRDRVEEIQAWCDERRMLDLQVKLQHWLHGWLFIHAPVSFLLLMLTFWHAFVTLFYY